MSKLVLPKPHTVFRGDQLQRQKETVMQLILDPQSFKERDDFQYMALALTYHGLNVSTMYRLLHNLELIYGYGIDLLVRSKRYSNYQWTLVNVEYERVKRRRSRHRGSLTLDQHNSFYNVPLRWPKYPVEEPYQKQYANIAKTAIASEDYYPYLEAEKGNYAHRLWLTAEALVNVSKTGGCVRYSFPQVIIRDKAVVALQGWDINGLRYTGPDSVFSVVE